MKINFWIFLLLAALMACSTAENASDADESNKGKNGKKQSPNKNLQLLPALIDAPEAAYKDLELGPFLYDAGELKYIVMGATLGTKTPGAEKQGLQVSGNGLYLHIVLNDSIHFMESNRLIPKVIADGTYNMTAFVARSWHESVKNGKALVARKIDIKAGRTVRNFPLDESMLIYGVPIGTYSGTEAEKVLLDFYLHNTSIGAGGNRVRVLIDGKYEFFVDKWQAYYIKGLGLGEHSVEMELQNSMGQRIYGPLKQGFVTE